MKQYVCINSKFVTKDNAVISVFDHGLLYGDGIFETMRSYNGRIFQVGRHIARLYKNADSIQLNIPISKSKLKGDIYRSIKKNGLIDAYIKVLVTRGVGEPGINIDTCKNPCIVIITKQAQGYPKSFYTEGMRVVIADIRQNNYSPLPAIKSFNYLNNILAKLEAKKKGFMDTILLNVDGFVTEATASNIFVVRDAKSVLTPSINCGILSGVTREVLIKIIKKFKLKIVEKNIRPQELLSAKEVFLTNSIGEVLPVIMVNNKKIGDGIPGEVTKMLHNKYKRLSRPINCIS